VWNGRAFDELSWGELADHGLRAAGALRRLGAGARAGVVFTNEIGALAALLGTWFAGAAPVSMPLPARGVSHGAYRRQLEALSRRAGVELLLVSDTIAPLLGDTGRDMRIVRFGELARGSPARPSPPSGEEVVFVQCSSGTTGDPQGCELTGAAVARQLELVAERIGAAIDGRYASWLPLSHDMGMFGLLLALYAEMPALLSSPERFLMRPRSWLDDCGDFGATLTAVPPSALDLAVRAARGRPPGPALRLRTCVVGAEPIAWDSLARSVSALGDRGLTWPVLTPAYGLAEATLAVTMKAPGTVPSALDLDADALARGRVACRAEPDPGTVRLVSCGSPLREVELDVEGDADVGTVRISSPSLASGYLADPARTAEAFDDGWLRTSDLGFVQDGELYVVGRSDDVLTPGGRNVNATQVERELDLDPGVRTGCCGLVEVGAGGERLLVLVAERSHAEGPSSAVASRLSQRVGGLLGRGLDQCVFVPRGTFPKTPTGKVQRHRCRAIAQGLEPVGAERFDLERDG
jgi:acyl-CoA synthetase (AMP-forming)/AMP-acid ligase II